MAWTKEERREYMRKHYAANKEKYKARSAKIYSENKEIHKEVYKARSAKYRAENPEKVKEARAKWIKGNTEKVKSHRAKWLAENPEKYKASRAKWYSGNSEKAKDYSTKWAKENPEKVKGYNAKGVAELKDYYITRQLRMQGFKNEQITPELIELKRITLKTTRLCRQLNT